MGYADGGDLSQKIQAMKKSGKSFTEEEVLDYFVQICLAINHIHEKRILHRDLKTQVCARCAGGYGRCSAASCVCFCCVCVLFCVCSCC